MPIKWKILIAFIAVAALVLPWQLFAGVCAQRVVKHVTYAQPVAYQQVAYQAAYVSPYSYAIGSDLVLEALAEKLAQRIEQKLVERQKQAAPQSIVAEKCAKCHSPQSRAVSEGAPPFFDQLGQLTATPEQRASMATASKLGAMPPPPAQELTDDEYIELRRELERGIVRPAQPQSAPEPPPAPVEQ